MIYSVLSNTNIIETFEILPFKDKDFVVKSNNLLRNNNNTTTTTQQQHVQLIQLQLYDYSYFYSYFYFNNKDVKIIISRRNAKY